MLSGVDVLLPQAWSQPVSNQNVNSRRPLRTVIWRGQGSSLTPSCQTVAVHPDENALNDVIVAISRPPRINERHCHAINPNGIDLHDWGYPGARSRPSSRQASAPNTTRRGRTSKARIPNRRALATKLGDFETVQ